MFFNLQNTLKMFTNRHFGGDLLNNELILL